MFRFSRRNWFISWEVYGRLESNGSDRMVPVQSCEVAGTSGAYKATRRNEALRRAGPFPMVDEGRPGVDGRVMLFAAHVPSRRSTSGMFELVAFSDHPSIQAVGMQVATPQFNTPDSWRNETSWSGVTPPCPLWPASR